jgi:hypothetical protein
MRHEDKHKTTEIIVKPTGPQAIIAATQRPKNYNKLTPEDQWAVDKALGILDWDGDPRT